MIVLDTNVVSELMRPSPSRAVLGWVDGQPAHDLHITSVTLAELLYGLARLPDGRRRGALAQAVDTMVTVDFDDRVLAFDAVAAAHFANIAARRERAGRPIGMADAQIAAICRSHDALLATRDTAGFEGTDVTLANPWGD